MTADYFTVLLTDCMTLLNPQLVVSHGPETDPVSSPHLLLLHVLSDGIRFLSALSQRREEKKTIYQSAVFKIRFYMGQILSPLPLIFPADGVRFVISKLAVELKRRNSGDEERKVTREMKVGTRPMIEEENE